MKTIVFGDIHGRTEWYDIVQAENPDKVIFLGDYVSTHEDISSDQQCGNLEDIMNFKECEPDRVVMLFGNHDLQHLGYYWAECSGLDRGVYRWMSSKDVANRFLKCTQAIYIQDNLLFSHAGVSKVWWNAQFMGEPTAENLLKLNEIEPCEIYAFTPERYSDWSGESTTQPPVWIRPTSLLKSHIEGWDQVVGHTRLNRPGNVLEGNRFDAYRENWGITMNECWIIDCMPHQYMVIEDGKRELREWKGVKYESKV